MAKTNVFKAIGTFVSKNSPVITAVAAVGGLVTTVVVACKATPKYLLAIDNAIAEKGEELNKKEKAKIFIKAYGTTIVSGVLTTSAIVASPLLMKKNCDKVLTGALAAYTVAENKIEKLNKAIKEELPKKEQEKIATNVAKQTFEQNPVPDDIVCPAGKMIFLEEMTGQYFVSTPNEVKAVENWLNSEIIKRRSSRDGVSLGEVLERLGAKWCAMGNEYEWNFDYTGGDPIEFNLSGAYEEERQRTVTCLGFSEKPAVSTLY